MTLVFREQSEKWREFAELHIKTIIVVIDHFLRSLLAQGCSDKEVAHQLWENAMHDQLVDAYKRALAHAEFLVDSELLGRPYTYNCYFNENLQRARNRRLAAAQAAQSAQSDESKAAVTVTAESADSSSSSTNLSTDVQQNQPSKTNADQVKEDIFDILESYYKIARVRFVDAICQQVVSRLLLDDDESPLKVLCPELIAKLTDDQLEHIAGEDNASRIERMRLDEEIQQYQKTMEMLKV